MSQSSPSVDLFEYPDRQPPELRRITDQLAEDDEADLYEVCREVLAQAEAIGYTFDFGLDGVAFNLRPLQGEDRVSRYRHEVRRLDHQIAESNFFDDPPSVIESLGVQREAAQQRLQCAQGHSSPG